VTSSTGYITLSESQLDEASPSFILFVKVPLLYYPPIDWTYSPYSSSMATNASCAFRIYATRMYALASQII
jgi:hypothetical protein